MFLFGTIFIILSFLTGGITVYNFIEDEELNYFSLNTNLLVGIFLAVLGIGLIIISKLEEIKWVLNNQKRSEEETVTETFYTDLFKGTIEEIAQKGAQKMLQMAMEAELMEHIEKFAHLKDENNHRIVNRNGQGRERTIQTGIGPLAMALWDSEVP
jgi:hypothetical protein